MPLCLNKCPRGHARISTATPSSHYITLMHCRTTTPAETTRINFTALDYTPQCGLRGIVLSQLIMYAQYVTRPCNPRRAQPRQAHAQLQRVTHTRIGSKHDPVTTAPIYHNPVAHPIAQTQFRRTLSSRSRTSSPTLRASTSPLPPRGYTMAARGRPRAGAKDEIATHEERDLWGKIVTDLKDLTRQSKRASELVSSIKTLEYRDDDQGGMCAECGVVLGAAAGVWRKLPARGYMCR